MVSNLKDSTRWTYLWINLFFYPRNTKIENAKIEKCISVKKFSIIKQIVYYSYYKWPIKLVTSNRDIAFKTHLIYSFFVNWKVADKYFFSGLLLRIFV